MKRDLSPRELEVLALVAEGLEDRQIAVRLQRSTSTIKTHVVNIYAALGVNNRVQAARWYWEREQGK